MAERYLGVVGMGEALGVTRHAVHKWRSRHPPGSDHPFPHPDVEIDGAPGWRPDRVEEVVQWRNGLPGRGAGGGRPSASMQEYMKEAFARDLNEHEALSALDAFQEEYPELTRAEVAAWLLGKWRD